MHIIAYVSDITDEISDESIVKKEMLNIVGSARKKNKNLGVTGVLFFENNHFFQIIEGEEKNLRFLYEEIRQDVRHCNIKTLLDQPVPSRTFKQWEHETFYIDNPLIITPRTLQNLHELYLMNFRVTAAGLLEFVERLVDEIDTFKINKSVDSIKA